MGDTPPRLRIPMLPGRPAATPVRGHLPAVLLLLAMAALAEPALANKFETIGGGVSGSVNIKREWLQTFFLIIGGLSLFGAMLSILVPHRNALYLNFSNWKQSAAVLGVMSVVFFGIALIV